MSLAPSLAPGEIWTHEVVVAENAVACSTCGTVVLRRPERMRDTRWEIESVVAASGHVRFPAATPS